MTQPSDAAGSQSRTVWSSQLRIVAGRAVEEAPQVGFVEKVDQVGRLVRLSILAESAADGGDAFMDQFVRRISELFDPAARSLTGAVKFAVETTHEELRDWNRQHLPAEHAMYGLSCLIQRDDQPAVLGQAGPSVGLVAGDPGLAGLRSTTLYAHSSHSEDPVAAPIGSSAPLNLEFAAGPEAADGWALLLSSNSASLLDAQRRVALSRLAVDETLRHLYAPMVGLRDGAGLVVSLTGGGRPTLAEPPVSDQEDAEDEESFGDDREEEFAAATDEQADSPVGDEQDRYPGDDRLQQAAMETDRTTAQQQGLERSRGRQWEVSFAPAPPSELEVAGWPVNPFAVARVDLVESMAGQATAPSPPMTNPIVELGRALPSLLENRREPAVERPKIRSNDPRARSASFRRAGLVLLAMLVLLGGVAAVLLGPSLLQSDEDQVRASVERARNGLAASQLAATTDGARLALEDALSDVEAALAINPLAADALQLREEIEAVLAELNLVLSPGELTSIAELSRFGPAIALGAVRFGDGRAFVLDDAGGRVFSVSAEGAVSVVFLEGELLGLGSQLRAGTPISLAWQSATDQPADESGVQSPEDALWILDSHSRLYRWTPSGVLLIPIPQQVRLGSVDAVAATTGSIFLLDEAGGAVWRFAVQRSELGEPVRAVGRTDLLNAEELVATINSSGEVEFLVAFSDGRLRRFSAEEELPLALDLERNLLSPASLSLGAQSGLIYVVDRGEGRVIAVGPDGSVVSQIQSPELTELRGAWVNEESGQIMYALPTEILVGRLPGGQE